MPNKTFEKRCREKIEEAIATIQLMQDQIDLYKKIKEQLPDVSGDWYHGCLNKYEKMDSPVFYSDLVNKDFDEMSFGERGCCSQKHGNPYYARPIKIIEGTRIRGTKKICIGRYDNDYCSSGYRPEEGWKEIALKHYGEKGVKLIQEFLDKHPHEYDDDCDEDCWDW